MSIEICNLRRFTLLNNNLDVISVLVQTFHLRFFFVLFVLCGQENMLFEVSSKLVFLST